MRHVTAASPQELRGLRCCKDFIMSVSRALVHGGAGFFFLPVLAASSVYSCRDKRTKDLIGRESATQSRELRLRVTLRSRGVTGQMLESDQV